MLDSTYFETSGNKGLVVGRLFLGPFTVMDIIWLWVKRIQEEAPGIKNWQIGVPTWLIQIMFGASTRV